MLPPTFALLAVLLFSGKGAQGAALSQSEYRQQLHDLAVKVESLKTDPEQARKLQAELPESVSVSAGDSEYSISYKDLKHGLSEFAGADEKKRPALLLEITEHVQALNAQAQAFVEPSSNLASEHGKLDAILAQREFSKVSGPTVVDRWLGRVYRWLSRLLDKAGAIKRFDGETTKIVVYILIGTVFVLLAVWIGRRLFQPVAANPPREIIPFSPSAKGWRTWLAEARAVAQQQDWRNAIHLAYWAGISFLEEHGAWKPDRARTPREYLRLLNARNAQHPVLTALTRKFEVTWYGHRSAREADFQETLGQLEKLGCR
ncbi:MAG TPA: DUF4129 domain-containing protein [Verrucomicrobiae bacterium]|nr:DUF4129 domain-containing protein [Verrucomicrobiae bacterium]